MLPQATVEKPRHEQLFTLPPKILRVMSFQFKETAADISFLNALVFLGGTRTQPKTHMYLPEQYNWIHNTLKNSASLDPYFIDPYNLMNSSLIWDRYKLAEVNELIASGADKRDWDYLLAYYAGFNYYYFLDDGDKSFRYLTEASKRSAGNPFFDNLAARVAYKANKTELAIAYLEQQIHQAELEGRLYSTESIKRRLMILKEIRKIELAVESYRGLFAKNPANINELVSLKLLALIPDELRGGSYYLDPDGKVHSTKDLK
jgi:hypothetical protein